MSAPRFLLDEHVWGGLVEVGQELNVDVLLIQTQLPEGTEDEDVLAFAASQKRLLLTSNAQHFAPLVAEWFLAGREHWGVIIVPEQSDLHHLIDRHYTLDEIRLLCFELGIDLDHLVGSEKLGKIAELVLYCQRRGRLLVLLEKLREQRPHVTWPNSVIFPEQPRATYPAAMIEPPLQRPARATHFYGSPNRTGPSPG